MTMTQKVKPNYYSISVMDYDDDDGKPTRRILIEGFETERKAQIQAACDKGAFEQAFGQDENIALIYSGYTFAQNLNFALSLWKKGNFTIIDSTEN